MGTSQTGTEIAVTGPLAAALDFGQGIAHGGNGLEFIKGFNDRHHVDRHDKEQEGQGRD